MNKLLPLLVFVCLILGCQSEQRPSYEVLENTLPEGGAVIHYDPEIGLTNINQVVSTLSPADAEVFNRSLEWYGTESSYGLDRVAGRTANQLVEVVNCLKLRLDTEGNTPMDECFE